MCCLTTCPFSYSKTEPSVEDISFRLKPGETLGIIGANRLWQVHLDGPADAPVTTPTPA